MKVSYILCSFGRNVRRLLMKKRNYVKFMFLMPLMFTLYVIICLRENEPTAEEAEHYVISGNDTHTVILPLFAIEQGAIGLQLTNEYFQLFHKGFNFNQSNQVRKPHTYFSGNVDLLSRKIDSSQYFGEKSSKINNFAAFTITEAANVTVQIPYLLIVVCSYHEHYTFRQAIRQAWGNIQKPGIMLIFLIGKHREKYWNWFVKHENSIYGDILQLNITESYANLSRKILCGISWVLNRLPEITYFMKVDDDVYINIPYLLEILQTNLIDNDHILGALNVNALVNRNMRDSWGVSYQNYPYSHYPPYVSGGAYVMTLVAARTILDVAAYYPIVQIEDAYITGILAKAANVKHVSHPGFAFWTSQKSSACDILLNRMVSSVNMSPKQIVTLDTEIRKVRQNRDRCF